MSYNVGQKVRIVASVSQLMDEGLYLSEATPLPNSIAEISRISSNQLSCTVKTITGKWYMPTEYCRPFRYEQLLLWE